MVKELMMKMLTTGQRVARFILFVATCLLIPFGNAGFAADELIWKFAVGNEYHYQMVQEMDMSMDLGPGGVTTTSMKQTMEMKWKVEALDENGVATVTQKIDRMQMDITAPGQDTVHYDSASDETPQGFAAMLAPMLIALTSEKFTVTMLPNGEITSVDIPKSFLEAISRGPGAAMMGGFATEEGFKNMATQGSLTLPKEEDLVAGHEWSTSMEIANPATGKVSIDTTYRYTGPQEIDGQQFEVFVPTIKTEFGGEGAVSAIDVTKQETTGEILFNRSAGRLESSTIDQQMEMVITAAGNEINQTIDQKITFKIIEPGDVDASDAEPSETNQ
jgi:hypothetical protein